MAQALAAYLHYLAIFALFALLSIEHVLCKAPLDLPRARSLIITDRAYGVTALVVLLTGAARLLWFGKGSAYYLHNSLFHAKLGLFVLVALLSIAPTWHINAWAKAVKAGQVPVLKPSSARWLSACIRLELLLLMLMPLLAVLLARGYGSAP
jgi:putative membrane protein